ncbi:hypothetical protein [Paraburkholderia caribensis]|uniref:hypothetical protein n=1 Tax=Paraburkholderia caribensis TaxID=75105 RepID=UPI00078E0463|nr:hypothetical protein [Paraburkholderia caribensis]AMV47809.1 hypothetical protein ATN79_44895 [Paraburkholderia caribensis]
MNTPNPWSAVAFAGLIFVLAGLIVLINRHYPLLRDAPTPVSTNRLKTSYSLGRVQMAFWTVLTIAGFLYVFSNHCLSGAASTFSTDFDINVVALLGISGATGLLSATVDATSDAQVQTAKSALQGSANELASNSRQLAQSLVTARRLAANQQPVGPLLSQNIQGLRTQRAKLLTDIDSHGTVIKTRSRSAIESGFWSDLLTDENGNSLHRLQVVMFTLMFGVYFCISVWQENKIGVALSVQALALMGVSNAIYLGFKIPAKSVADVSTAHTSPAAGAPATT